MRKLFFSIALMGVLTVRAGTPFHIDNIEIETQNCVDGSGNSVIDISVKNGTPPKKLEADNTNDSPQESIDGEFGVTLLDPLKPITIILTDSAGAQITQTFNVLPAAFENVDIFTQCPGTLKYTVSDFVDGSGITNVRVRLVGEGQTRSSSKLEDTFTGLVPGNYILTITPVTSAITPAACAKPFVVPIIIADLPFDLVARNTELSQGAESGALILTAVAGDFPFDFTLTGPLPSTNTITALNVGNVGAFSGLPGGFFAASVTDNLGCTVTKIVAVNFFVNAIANRIALAYC